MNRQTVVTAMLLALGAGWGCRIDPVGTTSDGAGPAVGRVSPTADGHIGADGAEGGANDSGSGTLDVAADLGAPGDTPPAVMPDTMPLLSLGMACTVTSDCASGFCIDGVCCDNACGGNCEACDRQDRRGTCMPITGAPRGGRPPCAGQGGACAGVCDGSDGARCVYPGNDQDCAPGRCTGGIATTRSVCSGAGACLPGADVSCAPFSCDGPICAGGCGAGRPCAAGNYCDGGRCFPLKPGGQACRTAQECAGNACVDGRCCGRSTCGTCESCTGAGGACVKVTAGEDPGTCAGDRVCVAGGMCRKKPGSACGAPAECASPGCVSGRCCSVATCGACATCTGAGGTCVPVTTGTRWEKLPGAATDIDVGPDGSVWVIGTDPMPGGFGIHRWNGTTWINVPGGATRIAVGPGGVPWVVNSGGSIFRRNGDGWQILPGAATDIDVGPEGTAWVLGVGAVPGGFGIYRWDGATWINVPGGATRIAVGPGGIPWVVNSGGTIFRRSGDTWMPLPGAATDIDMNAHGTVWVLGNGAVPGGFGLHRWNGSGWNMIDGGAIRIGVGPDCLPWAAAAGGEISRRH